MLKFVSSYGAPLSVRMWLITSNFSNNLLIQPSQVRISLQSEASWHHILESGQSTHLDVSDSLVAWTYGDPGLAYCQQHLYQCFLLCQPRTHPACIVLPWGSNSHCLWLHCQGHPTEYQMDVWVEGVGTYSPTIPPALSQPLLPLLHGNILRQHVIRQ